MPHKINGETVENITIVSNSDGTYNITYTEKFNLIKAHHSEIHQKLRKHNLQCQIWKNFKRNFILILLSDVTQAHLILEVLEVPLGCYEINKEDKTITIQIKNGKYNKNFKKR